MRLLGRVIGRDRQAKQWGVLDNTPLFCPTGSHWGNTSGALRIDTQASVIGVRGIGDGDMICIYSDGMICLSGSASSLDSARFSFHMRQSVFVVVYRLYFVLFALLILFPRVSGVRASTALNAASNTNLCHLARNSDQI